jgi:hypothetical protein
MIDPWTLIGWAVIIGIVVFGLIKIIPYILIWGSP